MTSLATIPASTFVSPSPRAELGGQPGLTLHEVAQSCDLDFKNAKQRFLRLQEEGEFDGLTVAEFSTAIESGNFLRPTQEVQSFVLDVESAKLFVATLRTDIGRAYRRHLIACESKAHTLDNLLADPANAARVFTELATQHAAAAEAQRLAAYSQAALTSSQTNTAKQTRRVHELEAELRQLNRMVSVSQWLVLRGHAHAQPAQKYTAAIRMLVEAQGHTPVKQLVANDKYPSWTFKLSWLDDNCDRIQSLVAAKDNALPKPKLRAMPARA